MAKHPGGPVQLEYFERTRGIAEGLVESRSEPGRKYIPAIVLQAVFTCTCDSFLKTPRRKPCAHMRAVVEAMDAEELRQFVLDAHHLPE